jgi:hypothetical protein
MKPVTEVPGLIPDAAGFCPGQAHTPAVNLVVLQEYLLVSLFAQIACRIGKLAAWGRRAWARPGR